MPLSRKQREKRKQTRVELDFKPSVKKMFKDMSEEKGVPMSQLVQFFALVGLNGIRSGTVDSQTEAEARANFWVGNECYGEYDFTYSEWWAMLRHYNNTCLRCGSRGEFTRYGKLVPDHVIPRRYGGPDTIENIQPLCRRCNLVKGAAYLDYRPQPLPNFTALSQDFVPWRKH
jgi:hypothetical protein